MSKAIQVLQADQITETMAGVFEVPSQSQTGKTYGISWARNLYAVVLIFAIGTSKSPSTSFLYACLWLPVSAVRWRHESDCYACHIERLIYYCNRIIPRLAEMFYDTVPYQLTRRARVISYICLAAFVPSTLVVEAAFGAEARDPSCGRFEYNDHCDFSTTFHIIIGDLLVGGVLALFFHHLHHRNQVKIDRILQSQENMNNRRKDYSVQHTKHLLRLVLFSLSMIRGSINRYNMARTMKDNKDDERNLWIQSTTLSRLRTEESRLNPHLQSVRDTLVAASDVLEPEVVNRVEGVINFIAGLKIEEKENGTMEFPKYNVCRIKLEYLIEMLQTYSRESHTFEEPSATARSDIVSEPSATLEVRRLE